MVGFLYYWQHKPQNWGTSLDTRGEIYLALANISFSPCFISSREVMQLSTCLWVITPAYSGPLFKRNLVDHFLSSSSLISPSWILFSFLFPWYFFFDFWFSIFSDYKQSLNIFWEKSNQINHTKISFEHPHYVNYSFSTPMALTFGALRWQR